MFAEGRRVGAVATSAFLCLLLLGGSAPAVGQTAGQQPTVSPDDYERFERLGAFEFDPHGGWVVAAITRGDGTRELRLHRADRGGDPLVLAQGSGPEFSGDGRWMAYRKGVPEGEQEAAEEPTEDRLGLVDLTAGTDTVLSDVRAFAFRDDGPLLALTLRTAGGVGNGVVVFDPEASTLRTVDTRDADYAGLTWRDGSSQLAALRSVEADDRREPSHDVLVWDDDQIIRAQEYRADQIARLSLLTVWHMDEDRVVVLGDDLEEPVALAGDGRWGLVPDHDPYRFERRFGAGTADWYRVDTRTGARDLVARGLEFGVGSSDEGHHILMYAADRWTAVDLATLEPTALDPGVDFTRPLRDYDFPGPRPHWGLGVWTSDGTTALLYDEYDVYRADLTQGSVERLTRGADEGLRYRVVDPDPESSFGPVDLETGHWETGQAGMAVPYWEDVEGHLESSPANFIADLDMPLLLMHGDADGVVDFGQGLEFYNYARRAGKEAVLLVYPGADHGLTKEAHQVDYHRRILEWFGHYLKGEPAARWITEGETWTERAERMGGENR